jgi:RNA polymerase sigma factor (sigma-70 family)
MPNTYGVLRGRGNQPGPDAGDVYRDLAPAVLGYLRAQGVSDAEDMLGEVFVQVARDLQRVSGGEAGIRKWVFTVARHRVIDDARRRARRPRISAEPMPDRAAEAQGGPIDPALAAALNALTTDQREVLVLRFVADLPLETVARITRRRIGAVKALQHRGLAKLAEAVSPETESAL